MALKLDRKYYNNLDVESFSQMLKDPSYCYKFYWLEAIVNIISKNIAETTFNDVIDEMIVNAWYSVLEFHIHLSGLVDGNVKDGLERTVLLLQHLSGLKCNASTSEILNEIKKNDNQLKVFKEQLTNMVPYRALAGFFDKTNEKPNWSSVISLVDYIKQINNIYSLPYTLGESPKLKKEVYFNHDWMKMIQDNTVAILGWIQYEKVKWLQNNNPEVPAMVYKLAPLDDKKRKLKRIHDLWDCVIKVTPIFDVFTDNEIISNSYDVDHFIPWSFVMNDELWNLMPMDSKLNSSKSNKLPKWNPFFSKFANNQYLLYQVIYDHHYPEIFALFQKCYKDNLHSIWANQELYRQGNSKEMFCNILTNNMQPVYDSARRQGYQIW